MSDDAITEDDEAREKRLLDDAIERWAAFRARVWQGDADPETVVLLHAIVGWEVYYPAANSFTFNYTTSPETTSPSASLGLANRLVANVEEDLGHRAVGVVLTSDDEEDD